MSLRKQILSHNVSFGPGPARLLPQRSPGGIKKRQFTPLTWEEHFEKSQDVKIGNDTFRIYQKGNTGPLLVFLHGGGFSALTWAVLSTCITKILHCQVMAIDLRGHGDTYTSNDYDLSVDTVAKDIQNIIELVYPIETPNILLIGHSMGGAFAVHVAHRRLIPTLIGVVVIDVVEGTAINALQSMQTFLRGRPSSFRSIEHAIEWCVRSGQVRNTDSARVSMPGQVKNATTNKPASSELTQTQNVSDESMNGENKNEDPSTEQNSNRIDKDAASSSSASASYTWRIDLSKTENYWSEWFSGLSAMFLSVEVPKLLLLAGIDRLDTELTRGHMQGKFQMQVLPRCGHAVQEDAPDKVAEAIGTFLVRHKLAEAADSFQLTFPAC